MATKTWVGDDTGNEGDLNVGANWSPSGVPTTGDDVIFGASGQSITANLDALASVVLNNVIVEPGANYALGSATDLLEIQVGSGDVIQIDAVGITAGGIMVTASSAVIVRNAPARGTAFVLAGVLDLSSGGILGGRVAIKQDPNFGTNAIATSIAANANIAGGTITIADTTISNGMVISADVTSSSNVGDVRLAGGRLTTTGPATAGTVTIQGGAFRHQSSGTITDIDGFAGSFTDNGQAYTLSAATIFGPSFTMTFGTRATTPAVSQLADGALVGAPSGATVQVTSPAA